MKKILRCYIPCGERTAPLRSYKNMNEGIHLSSVNGISTDWRAFAQLPLQLTKEPLIFSIRHSYIALAGFLTAADSCPNNSGFTFSRLSAI